MAEALDDSVARQPFEERLAGSVGRLRAHCARAERRVAGLEPDDLAQEVAVRALRYRASFDARRGLWPWLRGLARRVLADQRTRGARRPEPLEAAQLDAHIVQGAPAAEVRALETREELERLLGALSEREREVLERFHLAGQSVRVIADALGLPEGTVKSDLSRARRRLAGLSTEPTDG